MSISGKQAGNSLLLGGEKERHPLSLLDRANRFPSSAALSPVQSTVDQIVTDFSKNATDWRTLASITAGGMAYQWAKAGALPLRTFAAGAGLTAEVTTFEVTNRFLHAVSHKPQSQPRNLWQWEGRGGLKQGWVSSFLTFGSLKSLGKLSEGQNWVLQHGAQDTGMVAGHQLAYLAGLGSKPEGSLAEQFLQAEAMNLQLGAGMALGRGLAPFHMTSLRVLEEKVEKKDGIFSIPSLATPIPAEGVEVGPHQLPISMMSEKGPDGLGGGGGRKGGGVPPPGTGGVRPSLPPPPKDPLIGQTVGDGRYKIEGITGRGGMGTVYTCTQTTIGRKFALKVLRPDLARDPITAQRFLDEARAAPLIGNPHIIDVIDFGRLPDHSPYFVMEYLEGVPLSKIMEGDKPVPLSRLIPIAHQLAEGLWAAHQKGIIHRDLKPGNIFLVQRGSVRDFVKILDFGIAKIENSTSELTIVGTILGTPRYMSPEQAEGKRVDLRSDVYSFGVLLYKMASGKVPFDSSDPISVIRAHISMPPKSLLALDPAPQDLPSGLDAIVLKCLAKDPAERYQSMEEVMADLERLHGGEIPQAESERNLRVPVKVALAKAERSTPPALTPLPLTKKKAEPASIIIVPSVKAETPKSRWPLILGLFGLGGASALAVALYNSGRLTPPWNAPPPSPGPTPPPAPSPAATSSEAPSQTPVSPSASQAAPAKQVSPAPSSTPSPVKKKVEITIDPSDARVYQGEKVLGTSGVVLEIDEGKKVEIEIRRAGYKTKKLTLDGSQAKTSIRLERETKAAPRPHAPKDPDPETEEPPPPPTKFEKFE